MGAPVSAPVSTPPISIHICALTGPRTVREGPARSTCVSFDHLGLTPELLRAVADQGYTEPTPVQSASIPLVLAGRDLLAGAQTGTGKTAAFVLPMLQRLNADAARLDDRRSPSRRSVRALVLVPTRELALQVEESVRVYGARRPIRSVAIYGGVGFGPQASALRAGAQIVVATPGRLLDHAGQHTIDLSQLEVLVLDEADRMLDMGFIHDIRRILALLPQRRQTLLFSATFSDPIRELANRFLERPAEVDVAPRNTAAVLVRQLVHPVDRERKRELLSALVRSGRIDQALVFTRTKHGANRLAEQLGRDGIATAAIHGNKAQAQRVRALADFKAGRVAVLVATDIAARGLDIDSLPFVVNYEMPMVPEDYIHRIGRTGRAGAEGMAVSLVCVDEGPLLHAVERLLRRPITVEVVPGFEPDRSIAPEPIHLRSAEHRAMTARPRGGDASMRHLRPGRPASTHAASTHAAGRTDRASRYEAPGRTALRPQHAGSRPPSGIGRPQPAGPRPAHAGSRPQHAGSRPLPAIGRPQHAAPRPPHPARPADRRPDATAGADLWPRPASMPGERFARHEGPGEARSRA
jgi:ATP-dependent RNA helicase RhlE